MLDTITITNFKSFRKATLPLSPLTLLIGANASGKSNALEALQVLSWMAHGRRLGDVLIAIEQGELALRGTTGSLTHAGVETHDIDFAVVDSERGSTLKLELTLRADADGLRIVGEKLTVPNENVPLYEITAEAKAHGSEVKVAYNNFARGHQKPTIACIDQQPIFTQLTTPARFGAKHDRSQRDIPAASRRIQSSLDSILFLDPTPRHMRGYSFTNDRKLKGDGANISAVLHDLCATQGIKEKVLAFIRSLPEQDIRDIDFLKGPRGEVMVQLTETFGGSEHAYEAALLSDGTLRVLAIAAALLSVPEGSLVVIEEMDNGVHPGRAGLLLRNIQSTASERKLRVLLTTHNPALLDALPVAAIPHVVAAYRDPIDGDSRLVRLSDLRSYPELVARGTLGGLVTKGVLDRYLKSREPDAAKRAKALEWADSLGKTGDS
jgi:predicted ATPase